MQAIKSDARNTLTMSWRFSGEDENHHFALTEFGGSRHSKGEGEEGGCGSRRVGPARSYRAPRGMAKSRHKERVVERESATVAVVRLGKHDANTKEFRQS